MRGMHGRGFRVYGPRRIYRPMRPWLWRGGGCCGMGLILPVLGIGMLLLSLLRLVIR